MPSTSMLALRAEMATMPVTAVAKLAVTVSRVWSLERSCLFIRASSTYRRMVQLNLGELGESVRKSFLMQTLGR